MKQLKDFSNIKIGKEVYVDFKKNKLRVERSMSSEKIYIVKDISKLECKDIRYILAPDLCEFYKCPGKLKLREKLSINIIDFKCYLYRVNTTPVIPLFEVEEELKIFLNEEDYLI